MANFNRQIGTKEFQDNPLGMVVESKLFGSHDTLISQKKTSESIVKVIGFEKVIYSTQFEDALQYVENDYTPIGLIKIEGEDDFFRMGQVIPLLSKPEEFDSIVDNWSRTNRNTQNFTIKIIKSDFELDSYLQSFFEQGLQPVINPIFNVEKKSLESGLIVKSFQTIISEGKQRKSKVTIWRKDDKVRVVFPDVKTDKHATGILLTHEFIDEHNERCAIFQPIENGQPLVDLQFKLPIKLLQKWVNH